MQMALRLTTTILPGGKIILADDRLVPGENVDVIILHTEPDYPPVRRSAMDILAEVPGQRLFKTAADVDAYLTEERAAWDD